MTFKVGRMTLSTPQDVPFDSHEEDEAGVAGPFRARGYVLRGLEDGASAQATMLVLEKESLRWGDVWVEESNSLIPSGHYRILPGGAGYEKPRGAPRRRPWTLTLKHRPQPVICRQAEDDNVTGADTDDVTAEEASKVIYTASAGETDVLKPKDVAGAEAFNLPAGTWKILARVQSRTTVTQKFRLKTTKLDGTSIADGAQVTVGAGNADAWVDIDLGSFTIAAADHLANWFKLTVQANGDLNDVWIDRIKVVPA